MQWKVAYCNNEVRVEKRPISATYDDQEEANNQTSLLSRFIKDDKVSVLELEDV